VTLTALPTAEAYVTRHELAERMCVSVRQIDRFIAEGMPSYRWGHRTRRLLPSEALAWMRARSRRTG
jgi:hypothetical protein